MNNNFEQKNISGDNKIIFVSKGDYIDQSEQIRESYKENNRQQLFSNIIAVLMFVVALLALILK